MQPRSASWSRRAVAVALIALFAVACGSEASPQTDGAALYGANCAVCHGPDGQGTDQGPPLVHIIYEPSHHPDATFHRAVQEGVVAHHWDFGNMPPVPDVSPEEVDAIIAHVRALQREAGIE